jgi:hypothetical protein
MGPHESGTTVQRNSRPRALEEIPTASGRDTDAVGSRHEGGSRGGPAGRSKCRGAVAEGPSVPSRLVEPSQEVVHGITAMTP